MAQGRRRATGLDRRRRLRHEATVEAAVARGAGLDVREQVALARNLSGWGAAVLGFAAACLAPGAIAHLASGWGVLEGVTAVPALVLGRRTWLLQRTFTHLSETDDPALTDGDDEMAHLRELVRTLGTRSAQRVGRSALAAAAKGYAERRRVLERRGHVAALLRDADPHLSHDALAADIEGCDRELADLDRQLEDLCVAVAHLADAADETRSAAIESVRGATDGVSALASALDELRAPE